MKNFLSVLMLSAFALCLLLTSNGSAQTLAWGLNSSGQFGNGTITGAEPTPLDIMQSQNTGISGGLNHSVALQPNGTLLAWGNNNLGKLGDGSTIDNPSPVPVQGLTNVVAVAAGENHSMALKADGTVWVWGSNSSGQLGDPTMPGDFNPHPAPVQVMALSNIVAINAHLNHCLALRSDGTVWAWGDNAFGQLGNGTSGGSVSTPTQITGLSNVISIAAGFQHNAALKSDGTVWVWGRNLEGEVGNNTTTTTGCQCEPTPLQTTITGVSQITAGRFSTAAVKPNGDVFVWGGNGFGQLGNGTVDPAPPAGSALLPVQSSISNVIELKMRMYDIIARQNDGTVRAWGYNGDGQVGDGTTTSTGCFCQPSPVTSLVGTGTALINGGYFHNFAAKPQIPTNAGANQVLVGDNVNISFTNVTGAGTTSYTAINPTTTGFAVPFGYTIQPNQPAYNITTTATTSGNIDVCFQVPNEFNPTQFSLLKILHAETGFFVDKTFSSIYIRRRICARVTSLSPFVIALGPAPTAAHVRVSGRVLAGKGAGVSNALVSYTDGQGNLHSKRTNTFGYFSFDSVEVGQTYVFSVSAKGYSFSPQVVSLQDELSELNFIAGENLSKGR